MIYNSCDSDDDRVLCWCIVWIVTAADPKDSCVYKSRGEDYAGPLDKAHTGEQCIEWKQTPVCV